jgi:hypothetical protein
MENQNRTRNRQLMFRVTEEEYKMIRRKMILSKTKNREAYLRKMAIDGYIINTDTSFLEKEFFEMHKIGVNINQIAKVANSTGTVNPEDVEKLKGMIHEIWLMLRSSQSKLR